MSWPSTPHGLFAAAPPHEPKALDRLVVATEHQTLRDTGELFLGDVNVLAGDPGEFATRLDKIDRG